MKNKFYSVLFVALVSIKSSEQHGTKGGSFSGSYSSSSASSQSSSFSSSSSGSFSGTGSLNEVGAGLKDLLGNLAHAGAGAGSSTGGGANLGTYGGDGSKSGSFASAGSFGSGGVKGGGSGSFGGSAGTGGLGFGGSSCGFGKACASSGSSSGGAAGGSPSVVGDSGSGYKDGVKGISGSGSFGGTTGTGGVGGSACGFGNKACSGSSSSTTASGSSSGSGDSSSDYNDGLKSTGGSVSFGGTTGTGSACGFGNKACGGSGSVSGGSGSGFSEPKDYNSDLGVGGGIGVTGFIGSTFTNTDKNKPLESGNVVKEIPVKENPESGASFTGSTANSIAGSSGSGSANIEPLPLLPTTPSQVVYTSPDLSFDKKTEGVTSGQSGSTASSGGESYSSSSSGGSSGLPELVKPTTDKVIPVQPTVGSGGSTSSSTFDAGFVKYGSTNFGTGDNVAGKKPCCTGPFPGPSGSIHDSKPASAVPPVPTWGSSQSSSGGGATTGVYHHETGSYHGNVPTQKPPLFVPSETGTGVSFAGPSVHPHPHKPPFIPSVPGGSYSSGTGGGQLLGSFPGPIGSIHDSKPASSVPPVPSSGGSYSSGISTDGVYSHGTGYITHTPPCCKKPFPGPSGSIHSSKPASSVPPVPTIGGSVSSSGTGGLHTDTSATLGSRPCCKGPFPGPIGSIHDYKPASSIPPAPVSSYPTNNPHFSGSHVTNGGVKPTFPGPHGSIHESKPVLSGSSNTGYHTHSGNQYFGPHTGWSKHNSPGNGHYYYVNKPDLILQPPILSGTFHTKPLMDNYKPLNPDFIFVGTLKPGVSTSGSGYATGSVSVDKSKTIPISDGSVEKSGTTPVVEGGIIEAEKPSYSPDTDKTSVPFGTSFGGSFSTGVSSDNSQSVQTQSTPVTGSGSFGTSSTGSSSSSGFATGNVVIQKPDGTLSGGKDTPSGSSSGTVSTGGYESGPSKPTKSPIGESNGYATGQVFIQKPSESKNDNKDSTSGGTAGSTSGSFTGGTYGPSGSGDGYATGDVKIEKPDGSVTSGSDSGSSNNAGSTSVSTTEPVASGNFGPSSSSSGSGYATGSVFIQKPDGSITGGKDLPGGSYSGGFSAGAPAGAFGSSGSGVGSYGIKGHSASGGFGGFAGSAGSGSGLGGYGIKGSFSPGAYGGSHSGAGSYSGAHAGPGSAFGGSKSGSYAGAQSGANSEFTGLLKGLFGKHGLGGNLGSGSGSFAKSQSYAGSSSYAGAGSNSGSFSGASSSSYSGTY